MMKCGNGKYCFANVPQDGVLFGKRKVLCLENADQLVRQDLPHVFGRRRA